MNSKNKIVKQKKQVDHKKTNRNAIITAIILTLIVITSTATGLVVIMRSTTNVQVSSHPIVTQNATIERKKGKFMLKLYDYIARGQAEIHDSLSKI